MNWFGFVNIYFNIFGQKMWSLRTHSTYTFTILIILSYYYNYYTFICIMKSVYIFNNRLFTVAKKNPFWDIPQGSCQFKGHLFVWL